MARYYPFEPADAQMPVARLLVGEVPVGEPTWVTARVKTAYAEPCHACRSSPVVACRARLARFA